MKVYSDTLTTSDLTAAAPTGTYVEAVALDRTRVRSRGWNVRLVFPASNRRRNTGVYGAGERGAATWDQHGEWMARLFRLDPRARIAYYDGVDDFHAMTKGVYA
jgi:hypothetical protein